jgi:alpha-beta hydrolase superfamily lysophospholipase
MIAKETAFEVPASDGQPIRGVSWTAQAPPVAHVQIAHGRGEHARRYVRAARFLVQSGFWVHASDHRGHGPTALETGSLGDFGPRGFDGVVEDLAVVNRHIRDAHPRAPMILFGHSMGSFAAQYFVLDYSALVDGVMLCGTAALDLRDPRHPEYTSIDLNARVAHPRTPFDWLSRDAAEVDAYMADPLCGFELTPASRDSMYRRAGRTADPAAYANVRRSLPIALLSGDQDPINHFLDLFSPLASRLRKFGFADVTSHVFGGVRHEPLNDLTREEVLATVAAWIGRVSSTDIATPGPVPS